MGGLGGQEDSPSESERFMGAVADYGCLACHPGSRSEQLETLDERLAPRLGAIGERVNLPWMAEFLADPRGVRAQTTHPHQLAGLDPAQRRRSSQDLVAFLSVGARPQTNSRASSAAELEWGRQLFHSIGCVACHLPQEPAEDLAWSLADWNRVDGAEASGEAAGSDPDSDFEPASFIPPGTLPAGDQAIPEDLPAKYSLASLATFLEDPLAVRPSGHMPGMGLSADEARAIAGYLLRAQVEGIDGRFSEGPGLVLVAEILAPDASLSGRGPQDLPLSRARTSTRRVVRRIDVQHAPQEDRFVLRYHGILTVPEDGDFQFNLTSDDGSWLELDGAQVIDNGGEHGATTRGALVSLDAGAHSFSLVMFESGGDQALELTWEGPGVESGPIPPEAFTHWAVNFPGLATASVKGDAARGAQVFGSYGCATCHTGVEWGDVKLDEAPQPRACVSRASQGARFLLTDGVPKDLVLVEMGQAENNGLDYRLSRRSCLNCHRRSGVGGVHPERRPYFRGDEGAELGDEGRYPPHLTGVGRKLNDRALERALLGEVRVRPYTLTRMPRFGASNVVSLVRELAALDRRPGEAQAPPSVPQGATALGRRLAGIENGLGCVQCHDFLGHPSLGVRAVDLGQMHERLRWPWFRDLLLDPASVGMNSRMTAVFVDGVSPVQDVCGGDSALQAAALWAFLSEGEQMAAPPGLNTGDAAYELEPLTAVSHVGVFMRGVSPRVLCVGSPLGVHFAWDLENCRLAKAWRGRFMNVRGTWQGRAGQLELPPTKNVIDLAPGSTLGHFGPHQDAWRDPWPEHQTAPRGRRSLGQEADIESHFEVFSYEVAESRVDELIKVLHGKGPAEQGPTGLYRYISVKPNPSARLSQLRVRLARAPAIELIDTRVWRVGGPTPYVIDLNSPEGSCWPAPAVEVRVVEVEGAFELRAKLGARTMSTDRSMELDWVTTW